MNKAKDKPDLNVASCIFWQPEDLCWEFEFSR